MADLEELINAARARYTHAMAQVGEGMIAAQRAEAEVQRLTEIQQETDKAA